jgi:hypothetical protein
VSDLFDLERARERRVELLREAEERRIASALRRAWRGLGGPVSRHDAARNDRREAS